MSNSKDIIYVKKELKKVTEGTGPQESKDFAKKILDRIGDNGADHLRVRRLKIERGASLPI